MANGRDTKTGTEIDIDVSINVLNVRAVCALPDDGILRGTGLILAASPARGKGWRFGAR